jgi:predicted DNA-binding transcriptional regulator AlpA
MSQAPLEVSAVIDDELYPPEEVARRFNLKAPSLANMRSKGVGPKFIKLGPYRTSPVRYPRSALIEWIEANSAKECA